MKIEYAKALARLLYLLYKVKVLSENKYERLIDDITVKSLMYQIEEAERGKSSEPKE